MTKNAMPWSKFVWRDWKNDEALRQVSLAAQGLWMRMLCIMHEAEPYGHLLINGYSPTPTQLARSAGCSPDEAEELLGELEANRVFYRTDEGVIYNRRMVSDRKVHLEAQANGRRGGNPMLKSAAPKDGPDAVELGVNPPDYTPDKLKSTESKKDSPPSEGGRKPPAQPEDLFGDSSPPRGAQPPQKPEQPTAGSLLFSEGLEILAELTGKKANRPLLGKLRQLAGNDDQRLLSILRAAQKDPPAEIVAWVTGCLKAPRVVVDNVAQVELDDRWGLDAFCQAFSGIAPTEGADRGSGKWVLDGRFIFDYSAAQVAKEAQFSSRRVVDWSLLVGWLRDGLRLDVDIIPVVRRLTAAFTEPATSLRVFDKTIRDRRAA